MNVYRDSLERNKKQKQRKEMAEDFSEGDVLGYLGLAFFAQVGALLFFGCIVAVEKHKRIEEGKSFYKSIEVVVSRHADQNRDGVISFLEREDFLNNFGRENNLKYSAREGKYVDSEENPIDYFGLNEMLEREYGLITKHNP